MGRTGTTFWDLLSEPFEETMVTVRGIQMLPRELQPCGKKVLELLEENKKWQAHWEWNPVEFNYKVLS